MNTYTIIIAICLSYITNYAYGQCIAANCTAPKCACLSTSPPFGHKPEDIPQFIILTIDEAVRVTNYELYLGLSKYKNPNGCPIQATFFVSHVDTNYQMVHELHRRGHEIASESISRTAGSEIWKKMDLNGWRAEMGGQKRILSKYAQIPINEIVGARAPGLQTAGNVTYAALVQEGFQYECTVPSRQFIHEPLFPYTLDFGFQRFSDCQIQPCLKPGDNYTGFWSVPMIDYITHWPLDWPLNNETYERECATVDGCLTFNYNDGSFGKPESVDEVVKLFEENFNRHYTKNRAPFPMFLREAWLTEATTRQTGLNKFIEKMTQNKNVYFVSIHEVIDWMQRGENGTSLRDYMQTTCVKSPAKTACEIKDGVSPLEQGVHCTYNKISQLAGQTKDFVSCVDCPKVYPWVGNIDGDATTRRL